MFIGKPICIGAAGVIAAICLLTCLDKKVDTKTKVTMVLMTGALGAIVASL